MSAIGCMFCERAYEGCWADCKGNILERYGEQSLDDDIFGDEPARDDYECDPED